eukprot:UN06695
MGKWTNDDILAWINSMNLEYQWKNKLMGEIKNIQCNGKDIMSLRSAKEFGEAFDISHNRTLCDDIYREMNTFKSQKTRKNVAIAGGGSDGKFKINIYSQNKYMSLDEMVCRKVRVRHVAELYKRQSAVSAALDDIHLYAHMKLLPQWKTLEQVNIVDAKHLITVKFAVNGASFLI